MKAKKWCSLILFGLFVTTFALTGCCGDKPPKTPSGNPPIVGQLLTLNKTEYKSKEEIYVTAKLAENDSQDSYAWVGIYRERDDVELYDPIRWFYVNREGYTSGTTYGLQHSGKVYQSRQRWKDFPAGSYKVIYFADNDGTEIKETVKIKVLQEQIEKPSAPKSMTYTLDNLTDGLAEGELKISFDKTNPATELILYWANEDGVLEDYTSLATFKIMGDNVTLRMTDKTIIPAEATKLRAYSKNNVGISENYCEINLPENCQFKMDGQLLTEFQVISDIHISNNEYAELHDSHFKSMLADIVSTSPGSDGVIVVGDVADHGLRDEWLHMNAMKAEVEGLPEFTFAVGNHDMRNDINGQNEAYQKSLFMEFAGTQKMYYEKVINGYHHIILGSEHIGLHADLSQEQLNWFDALMEQLTEQDPDKPVFVYLHQSLYNTIAGSLPGQNWNGVNQDEQLRSIIAKYKQIYFFNGHSHWNLNSNRNMYVKDDSLPNIFNTSSVGYLWNSFYIPDGEYEEGSQGYFIKVYENSILVLGRDFVTHQWIPSACYQTTF